MNTASLNVLLIEDNPEFAELIEQWLSSAPAEEGFVLSWADSLGQGLKRLAGGAVDVILLDLSLPDSDGMPTFASLRDKAKGIPIIILSAADSEPLALRLIQEGAENYLVKSGCTAGLLFRALRYAIVRHRAQSSKLKGETIPGSSRVLGVIGAKGGVGATTVACNLARELHQQTAEQVLLADLDIQAGSVSFQMGLEQRYSVLDAVADIDHLDSSLLKGIVTHPGTDLPVLASPSLLGAAEPAADSVRRLVDLARPFYRWIVIDLGPLNCLSRNVLNSADEVFLVTTPAIPALYGAKRMIDGFLQAGLSADRIRLIVNQVEQTQPWLAGELKQMFGLQVHASLPVAKQDLNEAYVERRLPAENTKLRREIARLARRAAGLPEPQVKVGLSLFNPFSGRSRKPLEPSPGGNTPIRVESNA
jgi:Flp pilus assembly CpaE family ATPase